MDRPGPTAPEIPEQPEALEVPAEHWLRGADAVAGFAVSEGFTCTSFRVRGGRGGERWLPVVTEPPSWERLRARPAFYGIPLLFPYAHDIAGGSFSYRGRRYRLRPGRAGRTSHGFVRDYPWIVDRAWTDEEGDHLRASISTPDPLLEEFPFPFHCAVTFTLHGTTLTLEAVATNSGDAPMPMAFGIHPYFPIPFTPSSRAEDCNVQANVTRRAEIESAPLAQPERPSDATRAVGAAGAAGSAEAPRAASIRFSPPSGALSLDAGQRVDQLLDGQRGERPHGWLQVNYGRENGEGGVRWSIAAPREDVSVSIETSEDFRALRIFAPPPPRTSPTPPTPPAQTCISPVIATCFPDAFNLASAGYPPEVTGVIELAPGEQWRGWIRIGVTN